MIHIWTPKHQCKCTARTSNIFLSVTARNFTNFSELSDLASLATYTLSALLRCSILGARDMAYIKYTGIYILRLGFHDNSTRRLLLCESSWLQLHDLSINTQTQHKKSPQSASIAVRFHTNVAISVVTLVGPGRRRRPPGRLRPLVWLPGGGG